MDPIDSTSTHAFYFNLKNYGKGYAKNLRLNLKCEFQLDSGEHFVMQSAERILQPAAGEDEIPFEDPEILAAATRQGNAVGPNQRWFCFGTPIFLMYSPKRSDLVKPNMSELITIAYWAGCESLEMSVQIDHNDALNENISKDVMIVDYELGGVQPSDMACSSITSSGSPDVTLRDVIKDGLPKYPEEFIANYREVTTFPSEFSGS
jgi:hypothetical protein